jgi:hypothetical protein
MRIQMECGDKPNFVYARGRAQVAQSFEMIQLGGNMGAQAFDDDVWVLPSSTQIPHASLMCQWPKGSSILPTPIS